MKKILYIFIYSVVITSFFSCSDDDDKGKVVNVSVAEAKPINSVMTITLKDNETLKLTVHIMPTNATNKDVTFISNNTSVFEVSNDGIITPKVIGTDTLIIKATDGGGAFVRYVVNIESHIVKVSSITLSSNGQMPSIKVGSTFDLGSMVTVNPANATDKGVTYTSSNESVAMVNSLGVVTAKMAGTAIITIKSIDGSDISAKSTVLVSD